MCSGPVVRVVRATIAWDPFFQYGPICLCDPWYFHNTRISVAAWCRRAGRAIPQRPAAAPLGVWMIRRFSIFTSLPQSGSGAERRIAIGREQERIRCNPEPPPEHSDDEVEEGARITTRKQYREPGNNDA